MCFREYIKSQIIYHVICSVFLLSCALFPCCSTLPSPCERVCACVLTLGFAEFIFSCRSLRTLAVHRSEARNVDQMAEQVGDNGELERELRRLKFQRRGKKAAITIRIQKLEKLMQPSSTGQYTKRRIVNGALNALIKVFDELQQVCYDISQISEDDDHNDLETVRLDIDMCSTLVGASFASNYAQHGVRI